jgi:hypothetical protein
MQKAYPITGVTVAVNFLECQILNDFQGSLPKIIILIVGVGWVVHLVSKIAQCQFSLYEFRTV